MARERPPGHRNRNGGKPAPSGSRRLKADRNCSSVTAELQSPLGSVRPRGSGDPGAKHSNVAKSGSPLPRGRTEIGSKAVQTNSSRSDSKAHPGTPKACQGGDAKMRWRPECLSVRRARSCASGRWRRGQPARERLPPRARASGRAHPRARPSSFPRRPRPDAPWHPRAGRAIRPPNA
jgi:hypothetical protein